MLIQRISFFAILALVTIAFIAITLPFYSAILWAAIFAIVFFPLHNRIETILRGHQNIAAGISVLTCLCLVIAPSLMVLTLLLQQGSELYQHMESGDVNITDALHRFHDILPNFIQKRTAEIDLQWLGHLRERFSPALVEGGSFFAARALSFGQSTLEFVLAFGVMLYLLFFLFRDGRALARTIRLAIPLSEDHTRQFASKFTSVVRATIRGNVIIAIVQGSIGGVAFWALGLRSAMLLGVGMSILSLMPVVGAAIIWIPAAAYLALSGMWGKAVTLTLIGVFVIGVVDNLLRPPLVGQETRLPDYVVLLSTVGGIALVGINGFVIGPLVAALFLAAWSIFMAERRLPDDEPASEKRGIAEAPLCSRNDN